MREGTAKRQLKLWEQGKKKEIIIITINKFSIWIRSLNWILMRVIKLFLIL